ncbi:MAG: pyridoxamine 5'-phosphate oxidase family protein [Myxococcaceae bacterium]
MRRIEFHGTAAQGEALFREFPVMQLAGCTEDGLPVLKTLNGVVEGDEVCFHASPAGEKTSLLGRPVVVQVEETVARLPSHFLDAERACPATTLYRSAQVHGVLQPITEPARKARVLQALMEKLQPEGGYVPLDAESPLYRAQVKGLLVAGVSLSGVTTKLKLMQNKKPAERAQVLEKLWQRGEPGDARAIELIRAANPDTPDPAFLAAPAGLRLHAWLPEHRAPEAAAMLKPLYWNDVFTLDELERAHRGSGAWVGLTDAGTGQLIGTARAISDEGKCAWVYDVCVHPERRRQRLGHLLMQLLLDHPRVRRCRVVRLGTKDAQSLYADFGFVPVSSLPPRAFPTTEMALRRPTTPAP